MISDDRLQKALTYLATTDEAAATAKSYMLGLEYSEKTILATEQLKHEGTIQHKDALARTSEAYTEWRRKYEESVFDFEILRNKRSTQVLIIETWRSLNANQRKGNI